MTFTKNYRQKRELMIALKRSVTIAIYGTLAAVFSTVSSAQTTQSPTADLKDIIISSYAHHPQLKSLRSELKGTQEILVEARANYLPQLALEGSVNLSDRNASLQDGSTFDQRTNPETLTLRMSQTLYNGGRREIASRSAFYTVEASEARYETIATGIAAEIIQDYMSLLSAIAQDRALVESVRKFEDLETLMQARRNVGDSTRTEVSQTRSRLAGARARRAAGLAELRNARTRLYSTTGFLIDTPILPSEAQTPVTHDLETLKVLARQESPSLRAGKFSTLSAGLNLRSETRKHLPTVTLTANASAVRNSSPTIDRDNDLNVGVRFTMPIYTAGVGSAQTRRAAANYNAAKFTQDNAVRETDLRIAQLQSQLQSGTAVIEAQKASVDASEDALIGVTRGEEVGLTSTQDILDAAQNKLNADIALTRALYQQYATRLLLKLYIGEFDVYDFD